MTIMKYIPYKWHWNWYEICPTGLMPWTPNTNNLAPCFQQIFLQVPVFTFFAITSAYYSGRYNSNVARNNRQMSMLLLRIIAVVLLSGVSVCKLFYIIAARNIDDIWPIDVLTSIFEGITYFVHFGFLLALRTRGPISHRGPLVIVCLWLLMFLIAIIWADTYINTEYWSWPIFRLTFHCFYAISLIPEGKAVFTRPRNREEDALLGTAYVRFQDDVEERALGRAQDEANCFSKLLFYWVNPLIQKGVNGYLQCIDDLFDLPECLFVPRIALRLRNAINSTQTLFRALHKAFGKEFYGIGLFRLIADLSGFAGPLLLSGLLRENSETNSGTDLKPYLYSFGLFSASLLASFCGTHFNWRISQTTMKMRIGLITAIYNKSLDAKNLQKNSPDILNLMATDTDRIVNSCISFHSLWSIPFQLFTTLYLLYTQIGSAFVAGVLFAAALIPLNRWIALKIGIYSQQLMAAKDSRIGITVETLTGAKHIKLLAWEDVFIDKIQAHRKVELSYLKKRKYLDALCVYFWATTPVLMCLLTFGVSVLMGNSLTAASTFTSVALLNMLIGPLNAFPWVLNGLTEAWVSLKRVQILFDLPNVELAAHYSPLFRGKKDKQQLVLRLLDATFEFDQTSIDLQNENRIDFQLKSINFDVEKGDLLCLEGPVGGGKSSILLAILGVLNRVDGEIFILDINQGFGFVGQNHWLQRGTIRENILWGSAYDEARYKKILWSCALTEDIATLGGDQTGVGENGRTLSGGQRARVALARAIYQDKQIYLLDDILSALDTVVANHIVRHCILGLLKNKTRIIVTEHQTLFYHANTILHVEDGKVTPSTTAHNSFDVDDLLPGDTTDDTAASSMETLNGEWDNQSLDSLLDDETREYGTLSTHVITSYWASMGAGLGFFVLFSVILMQVTRNLSDLWLAHWLSETSNQTTLTKNVTENSTGFYLGIYTTIALTNSLITFVRAFLFAFAGIKAAKYIHDRLLKRVMFTEFKFFDLTPLGRILNRFSSDIFTIDDSLPFILNILLAQLAGLIGDYFKDLKFKLSYRFLSAYAFFYKSFTGALCITLFAMPWLALLIIPMCPIYLNLQRNYRHSSRDIKRLSSNALSPLYAHFTETLQGLVTIRAMQAANRFKQDFLVKLEESIRAQLTQSATQQWLGLRLQILGAFLVGGAGLIAAVTSAHTLNPGMVGLAISYALSITGLLSGVLSAIAETEQEMIAIERVDKYLNLETEKSADGSINPPFGWPCQGVVSYENVSLKYREHLSPALLAINLQTASCERIGIVGRTGAGKSSLLAAIARVEPISSGTIKIDLVDIATLPLDVLRNRIAFVSQEPFLFTGTIRANMDPRGLHLDSQIWSAINKCLATPLVQSLGGLTANLDYGGSNLSSGQRQLLCLARALLKNSKIVCIDEGTANLDSDSEVAIQLVLRNAFKSSTVLLIAHRINSLQHMDRIIVMSNGRIVEQGEYSQLGSENTSMFYSLLNN